MRVLWIVRLGEGALFREQTAVESYRLRSRISQTFAFLIVLVLTGRGDLYDL